VVPPIAGGVNAAGHLVVVLTGANAPANRAAVTVKTPTCVGAPGTTVTCPFDVPSGATVALVAEEAGYAALGVRALGSRPPDNFPVEFTGWTGDVAGDVEFGLLRLPMDRARRVEARFRLLQPITIARRSGAQETMRFRVTLSSPQQLSLPPSTPSAAPFASPAYGGSASDAVLWFFLRTGATATVEALDDVSAGGCVPSAGQRCSRFVAWEGDCSGTGSCVLTGGASARSVVAVSEEVGGSAQRAAPGRLPER